MAKIIIGFFTALIVFTFISKAQNKFPVIRTNAPTVSIRDGEQFNNNTWPLDPKAKPDVYKANLVEGKAHTVTFISDIDSISFAVEEGKTYDFIILWNGKECYTQILGTRFTPAASFNDTYRKTHDGKIFIRVPKVYELMNVAIAITPFGK